MSESRQITGVTIEADSVCVKGADFDWLCQTAKQWEQFGTLLGLRPERAQLCDDGHEPIIHFSGCPLCTADQPTERLEPPHKQMAPDATPAVGGQD